MLSTAVIFLAAGFVLGDPVLGVISVARDDEPVVLLAELALIAVLFCRRCPWPSRAPSPSPCPSGAPD